MEGGEGPRLVMAIKVRNEAELIEANLRHHLAHGVDFFVVTDNGSDDGTREILQRWQDEDLMEVIDEPHEDFWSRAHGWVTRMARVATERHGADWVLHADADEFWVAPAGSSEGGARRRSGPLPGGTGAAARVHPAPGGR